MIVLTRPEWLHVVEKLRNSRDAQGKHVISADTETVDAGWPSTHITGFSVAWYEGFDEHGIAVFNGAYIPLGHSTGELQLSQQDVYHELKEILEDPNIGVVFHNAKYDVAVFRLFSPKPFEPLGSVDALLRRPFPDLSKGIQVAENITDTFILHFLSNTNGVGTPAQVMAGEGAHGLKDCAYYLLGHKMTELADLAKKEKFLHNGVEHETLRTDMVPVRDKVDENGVLLQKGLGGYAWDDAVQTLKLRDYLRNKLRDDPKTTRVYEVIHREFTFVLAEMEMFGVELDVQLLVEMRRAVETELRTVKEKMYRAREGQNFDQLVDAQLIVHACEQYDDLERRFGLPKDHVEFPKKVVTKGEGRGKARKTWEVLEPASKGTLRTQLFKAHGLTGHPIEEMIRNDKLRPELKAFPELAHKIFNVSSNPQLNKVLFDECGLSPIGQKSEDGLWSTKAEYIEIWADKGHGHPLAVALERFREIDKLHGTYLVGMPGLVAIDARLRTRFNQSGARTGRLSSSDPNLQNIPTSSEFAIRRAFVATGITSCDITIHAWVLDDKGKQLRPSHLTVTARPNNVRGLDGGYELKDGWVVRWWGKNPPWVLFVGDYSQLEIALLAHVSGDETLIDAVTNKVDIHALTAQACFDEVPKDISLAEVKKNYKQYRSNAKPISFGVLYGMGPAKLAKDIRVTPEQAKVIINERYMAKYPGVKAYIEGMHTFAVANGWIQTQTGRKRHLPAAQLTPMKWQPLPEDDPYMVERARRNQLISQAKRQAQNTPIQGFAADLVALAMRDIRRHFRSITWQQVMQMERAAPPSTGPRGYMDGEGGERPGVVGMMWGSLMRSLIQVHDEMIQESHPAVANYVRRKSVELMERAGGVKLRIPLRVDAALGTNWLDTKE